MLNNPDDTVEYVVYSIMQNATEKTVKHIKNEIRYLELLRNHLIVTRDIADTTKVIDVLDKSSDKLHVGGKLKIMPVQYAEMYLPLSKDNKQANQQFLKLHCFEIVTDMSDHEAVRERGLTRRKFDYVVRYPKLEQYEGEEFYLANLPDNDLTQIRDVASYSPDEYERDGRRAIILTTKQEFHKDIQEQLVFDKHIHYQYTKLKLIDKAIKRIFPDVQSPKRELKKSTTQTKE